LDRKTIKYHHRKMLAATDLLRELNQAIVTENIACE